MRRFMVTFALFILTLVFVLSALAVAAPIVRSQVYAAANPGAGVPSPPTAFDVLITGFGTVSIPATANPEGTSQLVYDIASRALPPGTYTLQARANGPALSSDWSALATFTIYPAAKYEKPNLAVEP